MSATPPADTALRFRCPACQLTYRVRNADPAKTYSCKKCNGALELLSDNETVADRPQAPKRAHLSSAPTLYEPPPAASAANAAAPVPGLIESGPPTSLPRLKIDAPKAPPARGPAAGGDLLLDAGASAAPDATDLKRLLPETFDGYRVTQEIARGGMGAVMLAEQPELRRKVALKIILPWAGTDQPAVRERFMREARAMAKLKHPHIVEVYGVGVVNGLPYLAMEFVEGRTLNDFIEGDRLGYPQATEVLGRIARALAYAHSRGVIHRDIKPANIMLRNNGEPVLMDFGLAKDFDANTLKLSVTGNIMGTPAYMSPEQAQGLKTDERSDIYSLGAVLYEALTLEPPFGGETTIATMFNVVNTPARPASEIRPGVPEGLSRICAKALEKDVTDRYQTMDEFAGDLDRFGAGMQIAARGPSTIRRVGDFARANRVRGAAFAAAAAVVLAVGFCLQFGWLRSGTSKAGELRAALTSGSPETRLLHVKALAGDLREKRILPDTPAFKDALAALRQAVADNEPSGAVQAAAAEALAEAGDRESQDLLVKLLDVQHPAVTRRAAVAALARLDAQGLALIMQRTIQKDLALDVRLAAIEAMPRNVGPDVTVFMIELSVKGDPPAIAAAASRKLGQLRSSGALMLLYGGADAAPVSHAINSMLNAKRQVEQDLEEALAQTNPNATRTRKPFPFELAAKKLRSPERNERLQAAYDLGVLADVRSEPVLVGALQDADGDVALTAAESLGKLSSVTAPDQIAALLRNPAPSVRRAAARAYGLAKPLPDGAPLNEALLQEKVGPVQGEQATALGRLRFAGAVTALLTLLTEGTLDARRRAAWALGQIGDKSACGPLVEALDKATDTDVCEDLAAALSAITGLTVEPNAEKWREALKGRK